jgi:hypothetical protein
MRGEVSCACIAAAQNNVRNKIALNFLAGEYGHDAAVELVSAGGENFSG